jgi:hypothetical protein
LDVPSGALAADAIEAVSSPVFRKRSAMLSGVKPKGVDRALARLRARLPQLVYGDAYLEGNTYTEPEVRTLLDGEAVGGKDAADTRQVMALSEASALVARVAHIGPVEPTRELSVRLNELVAGQEALWVGGLRGEWSGLPDPEARVTVNVMGDEFRSPRAGDVAALLETDRAAVAAIAHPVLRGATWAAFGAYHQYFYDGNKRTARYVMNAVLVSHGYDAILIPAAAKTSYEAALAAMYRSGDLGPYVDFLIAQYQD